MAALCLAGCAATSWKSDQTYQRIGDELKQAAQESKRPFQPEAVSQALLPPLKMELPGSAMGKAAEQRFDLAVNNAPVNEVLMGIVNGTRYSMLVHPDVSGTISVNLKDVTVVEALDAIRDMYGYEYKLDGTRIFIQPLGMQIRIFKVNYLVGVRKGKSNLRVNSGSINTPTGTAAGATGVTIPGATTTGGTATRTLESSSLVTETESDFWKDLETSIHTVIGCDSKGAETVESGAAVNPAASSQTETGSAGHPANKNTGVCQGRTVTVNQQSGVIVVRAMPGELRDVAKFLDAAQLSVERQVILEAKILEVELRDGSQSGINWASFASFNPLRNNRASIGLVTPGTTLTPLAANGDATALAGGATTLITATPGSSIGAASTATGSLFGLAFQTSNFAALLSFLETQGTVHVLSSPRISTMNNQKAILKVGTDDFFVTNFTSNTNTSTGTVSSTNTTTIVPVISPLFSGILLDVTPQIDDSGNIILHIHPAVSVVREVGKTYDLGNSGVIKVPLAQSTVSETDSVVRARDGQIVAIGGLMKQSSNDDRSQVPGLGDVPGLGAFFRQDSRNMLKKELVILLKPTLVQEGAWAQDIMQSRQRVQSLAVPRGMRNTGDVGP